MLFNSHIFIFIFLPLTLAGWFYLNWKKKYQLAQGYLTVMSLWFYAYFNVNYLWMMLGSCLAGFLFSYALEKINSAAGRKWLLAAGCLFHLGLLGFFKYSNFFLENINAVFHTDYNMLRLLLPVGISFYTFQQLAYLIDRYRGDAPRHSFPDYLLFMVYFPQVLQGPILLHSELIPQFHGENGRKFDAGRFAGGLQHFTIGLSKKVLLADTLAKAVNYGYDNIALLDSPSAVLLAVGYLFELYFDFSGYCDMAVGLGKMIGIEIPENFDSPFKSASVREFWRRWHITLGRFFTRYVYIPLGGSRKGKVRTIQNTLIVFLLSGLWHGAAWTFVFWGLLHGLGVAWNSLDLCRLPKKWMSQTVTFAYVCLAFVFFRAKTIAEGSGIIKAMLLPKWNGFLFRMGEALDISELYIITKGLSMKAPALLNGFNLILLLALFLVSIVILSGKRACVIVEKAKLTGRYTFAMAFLFAWSILSMVGVGTFIYFAF